MTEVKNEALEALAKKLIGDCQHDARWSSIPDNIISQIIHWLTSDGGAELKKHGFTIAPIAQPVADEKLREAFDTLLKENNGAKLAIEFQYKYDEWPLEAIKAALAELAELRAEKVGG